MLGDAACPCRINFQWSNSALVLALVRGVVAPKRIAVANGCRRTLEYICVLLAQVLIYICSVGLPWLT